MKMRGFVYTDEIIQIYEYSCATSPQRMLKVEIYLFRSAGDESRAADYHRADMHHSIELVNYVEALE
ncbi:MAG: hypothetical protein QM296_08975 [Bacillota bacterium]|nr:hypothetical protein [Bacillota bacterium]